MEKKKVLFTATVVKTHIMEFHLPYLKMLKQMGWDTAVASKNDYENPSELDIPNCDEYFNIPFARNPLKPDNLRAYRMLKKVIDEGGYDIIHTHTPVGAILTRLAARKARKKGCRVIYTAHGFHFFKGAPLLNWLIYFPAEWLCSFLTDVLVTINKEDYAFAQKHMHPKKTVYIPGVGVDISRFGIHGDSRQEMRRQLGLREDDFVLLSVAELTKNKNHGMVLEALAKLNKPDIHFVCAGRGEQMEPLKAHIARLNLGDRVHMLGYRNDVGKLYAMADAFVFPSFREGLSVSLMEAMASGLPSIVSQIRGNTDLIDDGVEGIYTPITADGIAASVLRLYSDAGLRERCSDAAREKVKQFSLEPILQAVKALYLEA